LKTLLETAALILGLVNGLILLWYFLRDHPRLVVKPVHPEVYQWYFRLPDGEYDGMPSRRFGFLLYAAISNRGLRNVALSSWRLRLKAGNGKDCKLHPVNLPCEPMVNLVEADTIKIWPVLGQGGILPASGQTMVVSGDSVSGMVFYLYECFGHPEWDPKQQDGIITGTFQVKSVFRNKAKAKISFHEKPLEEIEKMVPGISKMDFSMTASSVLEGPEPSIEES
jgi:hypothetical protein